MDKPKINIKAWEPIEKRKKKNQTQLSTQNESRSILEENISNYQSQNLENDTSNYIPETRYNLETDERIEKETIYRNRFPSYTLSSPKKKYNKKSFGFPFSPQLLKTIAAGLGAIITGIVFGYIILNFFIQPTSIEETIPISPSTTNSQNEASINNNQIIPLQVVYMLQAGVFSEYNGAQTTLTQLQNLGRAAVISGSGPYHVFVGMSTSKESAMRLKDILSAQDMDLYVKEYVIPEKKVKISNNLDTFSNFIFTGEQLVQILSDQTINVLENPQYSIEYNQIQVLHQQFLLDVQALKNSIKENYIFVEQEKVKKMEEQMNYAITAMNQYMKSPNSQYLWNIQELLINFKLTYDSLNYNNNEI